MQKDTNIWGLKRLALFGALFGMVYSIARLSWGSGISELLSGSPAFLAGTLIGGAVAGAFLAVLIGAFRNFFTR